MKKSMPQARRILLAIIFIMIFKSVAYAESRGIASWYGGGEKLNRYTASGEEFSSSSLTAAMWDVPFGTKFKVTNISNNKSVIVTINDRGPARRLGRLIDLTRQAFSEIADLKSGLIEVKIEEVE